MRLKLKAIPTLVFLCILPILLSLGLWQLDRAEQKRRFFVAQEQRPTSLVFDLTPDTQMDMGLLKYSKVRVAGHYDSAHQFLLDNQISAGVAGYFVLTPFILQGTAKAVLVNRGWIALKDRGHLPDVNVPTTNTTLLGRLNGFPGVGIKLAGAELPGPGWPSVVGVAETAVLSKTLGYELMPFQVELDKSQAQGYKREWHETTVMRPEQHTAYAVQWFGLALTLVFLFFRYSIKRD